MHQHTALLTQALTWERHHRQTRYLLVGTDRQAAETWLHTRFSDGEPLPCTPSDLHCDFITESTKNASNLMTQVFLCHSDQDQAAAEQIRRSLLRQGITVWNYRTDIQTSQDNNSAISQGIEEADNIVFVLSPHSAQSPYCQQELAQALALHKRVIPVLAAAVEPDLVPEGLSTLQHIDLTDNTQASDYVADESQLLRQLNTDAAYHTEHKTWLVQALKWQRQQQQQPNPTLLLRGYNLRRAETWLKVARTHRHPPTPLHEQFIAESLRQPPNVSLDVFISYSRVDSDFARRLNDALQTQGKRTWFDQESIATGTDFQQEIYRGIESSDVFVFVLSPESINSPFCADEVEYAQGLNKRMVTVLHRAIDTADLHPVLKLEWLDFREHDGDFQTHFQSLLRTVDTDREHLEIHTRLLVRSGEWDRRGRDESLLLRGQDLQTAETWLTTNVAVEPQPTGLQQEYIRAARASQEAQDAAEKKLRRGALIGALAATAGILVAIGSGWFAVAANNEQQLAQTGTRLEQAGTFALSRFESDQIEALLRALKTGQELQAALTGAGIPIKAVSEYPATSPIFTLQQLQASLPNSLLLAHTAIVTSATFSPQGDRAVTVSLDGTARVWDLKTGASTPLEGYTDSVTSATFSPEGDRVVTASYEGTARVWDLKTGASTTLEGHTDRVTSATFSPEGDRVVTASLDGTARVWDLKTGVFTTLEGHTNSVTSATFSPEGDRVVTASLDGTARVWDLNGRQLALYKGYPAALSPDGQQVASVIHSGAQKNYEGVDEPTLVDGRAQVYDLDTLPELITWGCQWLHNYLEYGQATDADRALCNLPPRDAEADPAGPFESSLGRAAGLVGVTWPERSEGVDG